MEVNVGAARHVHTEAGIEKVVKGGATMIPDIELLQRGPVRDKKLSFRTEVVTRVDALLADIDAVYESGFGGEPWTIVHVKRLQVELASRALEIDLVARPGGTCTGNCIDGGTRHRLALRAPVLVELEVGVEPTDAVVSATKFTVGERRANGGLVENIPADPGDRKRS